MVSLILSPCLSFLALLNNAWRLSKLFDACIYFLMFRMLANVRYTRSMLYWLLWLSMLPQGIMLLLVIKAGRSVFGMLHSQRTSLRLNTLSFLAQFVMLLGQKIVNESPLLERVENGKLCRFSLMYWYATDCLITMALLSHKPLMI